MLKVLLKVRIASMFSSLFRGSKKAQKRGIGFRVLVGLLAVYVVICLFGAFAMMFSVLCRPLCDSELTWLYFSLAGLMAALLSFIGSVFTAQSQIFDAKDNELLLSMPIKPSHILASRMLLLLLLNVVYEIVVLLPAAVVYGILYSFSFGMAVNLIIAALFLPFFVLTLSCFFGWLVGLISNRLPFRNLFAVVLSVVFFALYFMVFSQLQNYLNLLVENGAQVGTAIQKALFPFYHFGAAAGNGSIVSLMLFLLCAVLPFALVYWILAKNFIRIATAFKKTFRARYREKTMRVKRARGAFAAKELRHFFSNAMYMLNATVGVILTLVGIGALIMKRADLLLLLKEVPMLADMLPALFTCAICFLAAMNFVSAPSVSLEGKNLWIARSAPVDTKTILLAKADAHLIICLPPTLLASLICCFILPAVTFLEVLLLFFLPAVVTVFTALFGVIINLHFPKFDWISETIAIKQGMSTMIAMFGSMAVLLIPTALYVFLFSHFLSIKIYLLLCGVLFLGLNFLLSFYLRTRGSKLFEQL